jgi:hypothetical protein
MKHLYAILIALSLAAQGMAAPLSEVEGEPQSAFEDDFPAVAKTAGGAQESVLSRWVGNGKTTAFLVAGMSVLPVSFYILTQYASICEEAGEVAWKFYNDILVVPFLYSSIIGLALGITETVQTLGQNLSLNHGLSREFMMALPALFLPVILLLQSTDFPEQATILSGLSGFVFLGGALWSIKDWHQKWRQPKADAVAEASQDQVFA